LFTGTYQPGTSAIYKELGNFVIYFKNFIEKALVRVISLFCRVKEEFYQKLVII
jgi:hypothetical protein